MAKHIRQKQGVNRNEEGVVIYTVVDTSKWVGELENHPSIVDFPDVFEISEDEIPQHCQILKFVNNE